jgi:hypothetical protein
MEEKKAIGFFEEKPGVKSSQRLIYITGQLSAIAMGWFILLISNGENWVGAMTIIISLSGIYGLQKLSQKRTEVKAELNGDK